MYNLASENTKSWFSPFEIVLSYFGSEWSFASDTFSSDKVVPLTKCAFVNDNNLILISIDGKYTVLEVQEENKELIVKESKILIEQE